MEEPLRKGVLLNFILKGREDFLIDVKAGERHGCSECEIVEFSAFYGGNRAANEIAAMDNGRS